MPSRRYSQKYNYFRNQRRRSQKTSTPKFKAPTTRYVNTTTGVPDHYFVKMVYTDLIDLNDAIGGIGAQHAFRGNSIFDPDYTSTGNQPTGRDEWFNFYNQYRVHSSKIEVEFMSTSSAIQGYTCCAVQAQLQIPTLTQTAVQIMRQPYCNAEVVGVTVGNKAVCKISNYMSTRKMYGIDEIDDGEYSATFTQNPQAEWFWNIQMSPLDTATLPNRVLALVKITYWVELFDRAVMLPS